MVSPTRNLEIDGCLSKENLLSQLVLLTLFRIGLFGAIHGCAGAKKTPLSKTCHTYPTIMKLTLPKEDPKII